MEEAFRAIRATAECWDDESSKGIMSKFRRAMQASKLTNEVQVLNNKLTQAMTDITAVMTADLSLNMQVSGAEAGRAGARWAERGTEVIF